MEIKTIGIVGLGMVGGTTMKWFEDKGLEVYGYSRSKQEDKDKVNQADLVFICVPTPYRWDGGGFDISIADGAISQLKDGAAVVIKSTVKIGTTDMLQKKYPKLKMMFNPELLSEATAWDDFTNPDRQFVGYTKESYDVAIQVLNLLPESAYDLICPAKEAELLKYINNMHGVLEVMESNYYYDVCVKEGLDYERVKNAMIASKWVGCPMGRHYREIYHKGKRGVGGKCFPKDLNAWVDYGREMGLDNRLFEAAKEYNKALLEKQGLTEEMAEQVSDEHDLKKVLEGDK